MLPVTIKLTKEQLAYLDQQANRAEFVRRLIDNHADMMRFIGLTRRLYQVGEDDGRGLETK